MIRNAAFTLVLTALFACSDTGGLAPTGPQAPAQISVLDIIDGDTIDIAGATRGQEIRVRLVGYDTPETYEPGCAQERALGNRATRRLQEILHDARDIRTSTQGTDRYNRLLMRMVVDGRPLADIMVSEGLAVRYSGGRRINWCDRLSAT